jgi:alpha-glucosidase (family GH31 glycosyl hydrolase)
MIPRPTGDFLQLPSGPLQARLYPASGHVELAGPDLDGRPLSNVITFQPPTVTVSGTALSVGRTVSSQTRDNALELHQTLGDATITARLSFPHDGVMRYEIVDWGGLVPQQTEITVASDGTERFYGFGETFNGFDQAGNSVRIVTFDQPGNKGVTGDSYAAVPWFVSARGYGFHLDSSAESTFDMRDTHPDRYVVRNPFGTLAFNVVYGPRLTDVLSRFTAYAGRLALLPPFAFGPWISSDTWRSGGEVRYAVTKFREHGIPASIFVFDSPWETAYNDFTFNMTQFGKGGTFEGVHFDGFSSLSAMMTFLQRSGLKVMCWMTPFVNDRSLDDELPKPNGQLPAARTYQDGKQRKVFVTDAQGDAYGTGWWKGHGSPVDFTSTTARDWLVDQLERLLADTAVQTRAGITESAVGGFKTDDAEALTNTPAPGNINHPAAGEYIPRDLKYADGRTGRQLRNGYCVEYQETIQGVLGSEGVVFARSGFTGSQAFAVRWAGDNEPNFGDENGLPSVIVAGQSAAMSGFSIWGHDIGGYVNGNFSGVSPENLFARWTQFGCFSPIMQMHRQVAQLDQDNPADLRQYPWGYGELGLHNYRFFARLHTRLFPYIYTYAKESATRGLPVIRPAVLLHQEDTRTHSLNHTYYFGNEFLVAPVLKPTRSGSVTERVVYLPDGAWFDFWTHHRHAGRREILWRNRNQQEFPLFVRAGAIIPMLLTVPETLCTADYVNNTDIVCADDDLHLLIYPEGDSSFTLYDDTAVQCQKSGDTISVRLTSTARRILIQVLGREPGGIHLDGVSVDKLSTVNTFDAADAGWRYDTATGFSFVKFAHRGGSVRVLLAD